MKRLICLVLLLVITITFSGCGELSFLTALAFLDEAGYEDSEYFVENKTGISIPVSEEIYYNDAHGGFLGDGDTFIQLFIREEHRSAMIKSIKSEDHWQSLPMTSGISEYIYDNNFADYRIPEVKNGYWYFHDSHSDCKNEWSDEYLSKEVSHNFEVAVYDTQTGYLYYFEYDS